VPWSKFFAYSVIEVLYYIILTPCWCCTPSVWESKPSFYVPRLAVGVKSSNVQRL